MSFPKIHQMDHNPEPAKMNSQRPNHERASTKNVPCFLQEPRSRRKKNKEPFFSLGKQSSVPAYGPVEQRALVVEPPAAVHRREELQLPQRRRDKVRPDGDCHDPGVMAHFGNTSKEEDSISCSLVLMMYYSMTSGAFVPGRGVSFKYPHCV